MQTEDSILITAVRNPFRPYDSRVTFTLDYKVQTVADYLAPVLPSPIEEFEIIASVNGRIEAMDFIPLPKSSIVFTQVPAGGNQGLRTIASIVVMAVSIYYGQVWAAKPWGAYAAAGIAIGGSILINALLPLELPDEQAASASYGFSGVNSVTEGVAFPVIYGTAKIIPPYIGMYMENIWVSDWTKPGKQALNVLCAIADHSVSLIDDVRINGLDISSYREVYKVSSYGSLSQPVFPKFRDTYTSISPNIRMDVNPTFTWSGPVEVPGSDITGIKIGIGWPRGACYTNEDGNMEGLHIRMQFQYRRSDMGYTGEQGWAYFGRWTFWLDRYEAERAEFSTLQDSYDNYSSLWNRQSNEWEPAKTLLRAGASLTAASYEIRWAFGVQLPTSDQSPQRYTLDTYIDFIAGINEDDFSYPGTSLMAVYAMATDQLSGGLPTISAIVTRGNITVYEEDGTPHSVASDNPAWICYDILNNDEYGCNVSYARINYSEFYQWATFCTTNSYTCNIVFDVNMSVPDALAKVSILGRGHVVQRGTKFGVVIDQTSSPVQMFTMGNIIEDSLKISYLGEKDRVNAIETKYIDAEYDYEERSFELRTTDFDSDTDMDENKISLDLNGATSKTLALRLTKFLLNCNEYLKKTVEFEVDVDALASNVGDVILVSHDVPQWGYSGRVVSATSNTVVLDRQVTYGGGGKVYHIIVRHYDDDALEEVVITNPGTEVTSATLNLTGTWAQIPAADDLYAFGENNYVYQEFRITRISRTQEMRRKITALEYNAAVYSDAASIPDYEDSSNLEPYVEGLVAAETFIKEDGIIRSIVTLTWRGFGMIYIFYKEESEPDWHLVNSFSGTNFAQVRNLNTGKTYIFAASTTRIALYDDCYDTITLRGYVEPRLVHIWRVSGLQIVGQGNNTIFQNRDLKLEWNLSTQWFPEEADGDAGGAGSFPPMTDFGGYRVRISDQNGNLRREFIQIDNHYEYTYEKNSEDGYTATLYFENSTGTFTAGEWIYQYPSGAYAKIESAGADYLSLTNIVGTFVDGQVIYQADYEGELLVDGDCSSDSFGQTPGSGAITYDAVNHEYDWDGTQVSNENLYQENKIIAGYFYKVVFTVKNYSAGLMQPYLGSTGNTSNASADGTYTMYGVGSGNARFYLSGNVNFVGSATDISLEKITNAAFADGTAVFNSAATSADPEPNLIIQVWARDRFGQESSVPAILSVSNPAPAAPSGLTVTASLKGAKAAWQKSTEIDIDHYEYRTKVESDDWSSWVKITNTEVIRIISESEQNDWGPEATIYFEVRVVDTFGNTSSVSSGSHDSAGLYLDVSDIPDELYSSLSISDSDGNSAATLAALYDRTTDSGGVAYTVSGTDKWIQYEFPLGYLIDRVCVWPSVAATVKAYVAYSEDGITWDYLKADGVGHSLTDGEFVAASNQSDAQTNYWLLTEFADNNNTGIFPAQVVAKKVRLYLTGNFSATLREVVFVRQVIAEQIVCDQLSAISADIGEISAGILMSPTLGADFGTYINLNSEYIQLGGTNVSYAGTTKGIFIGKDSSEYKISISDGGSKYIKYDGTDILLSNVGIQSATWAATAGTRFDLESQYLIMGGSDVDADGSAAGIFLGLDTSYKFYVGDGGNTYMQYDGTNLYLAFGSGGGIYVGVGGGIHLISAADDETSVLSFETQNRTYSFRTGFDDDILCIVTDTDTYGKIYIGYDIDSTTKKRPLELNVYAYSSIHFETEYTTNDELSYIESYSSSSTQRITLYTYNNPLYASITIQTDAYSRIWLRASDVLPYATTQDLGNSTYYWQGVYCDTIYRDNEASLSCIPNKKNVYAGSDAMSKLRRMIENPIPVEGVWGKTDPVYIPDEIKGPVIDWGIHKAIQTINTDRQIAFIISALVSIDKRLESIETGRP